MRLMVYTKICYSANQPVRLKGDRNFLSSVKTWSLKATQVNLHFILWKDFFQTFKMEIQKKEQVNVGEEEEKKKKVSRRTRRRRILVERRRRETCGCGTRWRPFTWDVHQKNSLPPRPPRLLLRVLRDTSSSSTGSSGATSQAATGPPSPPA